MGILAKKRCIIIFNALLFYLSSNVQKINAIFIIILSIYIIVLVSRVNPFFQIHRLKTKLQERLDNDYNSLITS